MFFRELVNQEKEKTRSSTGNFNSIHEVYGVLAEEVAEFFDQVRLKSSERTAEGVLEELVQIASVVEMAAEDMDLVDKTDKVSPDAYKVKYEELSSALQEFWDTAVVSNNVLKLQPNKNSDIFQHTLKTITVPVDVYNKLFNA